MVAFLDGKNKKRVALVDPVGSQAIEELAERLVIIFQLLNIVRFTRTTGRMRQCANSTPFLRRRRMRRFGDWLSRRVTVNSVQANGAAGKSSGIEIQVIAHDLQSEHSLKSVACW